MNSNAPDILEINDWSTPATGYLLSEVGKAEITRTMLKRKLYRMEGVRGHDCYRLRKPVPVTSLMIGGEEVMVDDPLNYYGMLDLAANCRGRVLIGGLGLGLILHGLQGNKEVTEIHVVEKEKDVIDLMRDNVPKDKRIRIIHADIKQYIDGLMFGNPDFVTVMKMNAGRHHIPEVMETLGKTRAGEHYDTVVLDVWWGKTDKAMSADMFITRLKVSAILPGARLMVWGYRDKELNPAVRKEAMI